MYYSVGAYFDGMCAGERCIFCYNEAGGEGGGWFGSGGDCGSSSIGRHRPAVIVLELNRICILHIWIGI